MIETWTVDSNLINLIWKKNFPSDFQSRIHSQLFFVEFIEAGVTFDNSFFDNCLVLVRQCKNGSFLVQISLVELNNNQT